MFDNNLWFLLLEGAALVALLIGTAYIFYPALTANKSVARNNGLEVVGTASEKTQPEKQTQSPQRPLLTVIVPAYNEELRLVIMLQEAYEYLSSSSSSQRSTANAKTCRALQLLREAAALDSDSSLTTNNIGSSHKKTHVTVEWILVNDGSTDETCNVYRDWVQQLPPTATTTATDTNHIFQLMSLQPNAGKGAAVQAGMLAATGDYRLMVDADGATEFGSGLLALATELNQNNDKDGKDEPSATVRPEFLLGSRAHIDDADINTPTLKEQQQLQQQPPNVTVNRSVIRRALSYLFHKFCVTLIGAGDIRDTQCGFKLLTAAAAVALFGNLRLKRWAFDTEIVFLSARLLIPMREVAVVWNEVDGSKLHTGGALGLAVVAVSMLRDMICVRLCYTLGIWKIATPTTTTASTAASTSKSKSA